MIGMALGCSMSRVMLIWLRTPLWNQGSLSGSLSRLSGLSLMESMRLLVSILMTSAPRSPSMVARYGPAKTQPKLMTRMP